jgi:hypothetical protein
VHEKAFKQGSGTIYQWNLLLHKAKLNVIRIVLTFVWAFNIKKKKKKLGNLNLIHEIMASLRRDEKNKKIFLYIFILKVQKLILKLCFISSQMKFKT